LTQARSRVPAQTYGVCRKDCYYSSGAGQPCEFADNGSMTFYTTPEACCKGSLASNNLEACVQGSEEGKTISTVGSLQWYVSFGFGGSGGEQPCAKDCDVTSTEPACGGTIVKTGVRMYQSAADCCEQAYSWIDEKLCEKESANAEEPTNLWYVNYGSNGTYFAIISFMSNLILFFMS
jgi:hypothetical protein